MKKQALVKVSRNIGSNIDRNIEWLLLMVTSCPYKLAIFGGTMRKFAEFLRACVSTLGICGITVCLGCSSDSINHEGSRYVEHASAIASVSNYPGYLAENDSDVNYSGVNDVSDGYDGRDGNSNKDRADIVNYDAGYTEGCVSGRNVLGDPKSKYTKDESRYSTNAKYKTGWEVGFAECQEQYITKINNKVRQTVNLNEGSKEEAELRNKIWNELKK